MAESETPGRKGLRPMKPKTGKFLVRIPPELHQKLWEQAHDHRVSLNEWVTHLLTGGSDSEDDKS